MQVEQMAQGGSSSNPDFFHDRLPSFQKNDSTSKWSKPEKSKGSFNTVCLLDTR
jgi:hypothetical protein